MDETADSRMQDVNTGEVFDGVSESGRESGAICSRAITPLDQAAWLAPTALVLLPPANPLNRQLLHLFSCASAIEEMPVLRKNNGEHQENTKIYLVTAVRESKSSHNTFGKDKRGTVEKSRNTKQPSAEVRPASDFESRTTEVGSRHADSCRSRGARAQKNAGKPKMNLKTTCCYEGK